MHAFGVTPYTPGKVSGTFQPIQAVEERQSMLFASLYSAPAHSELSALQAHSRARVTCDLATLHVKVQSPLGKLCA